MTISSKQAATLVGASTPASKTVELHRMWEENDMMKMREVMAIELPAGKRVNLHDSGYHLMLDQSLPWPSARQWIVLPPHVISCSPTGVASFRVINPEKYDHPLHADGALNESLEHPQQATVQYSESY